MRYLLLAVASVLALSGCEFQQDPISDASPTVRDGQPPEATKPLPEKPMDKEALQIDYPRRIQGVVGHPLTFKITGRVMSDNTAYDLQILNLADFQGATFNDMTGEFVWTPDKNAVGSSPSSVLYLRVRMVTLPNDKLPVITAIEEDVPMTIANYYSKPVITSITGPDSVVSGSTATFKATVLDIDAYHGGNIRMTTADCSDYYRRSLSHTVTISGIDNTTTASTYTVNVRVSLSGLDFPTGNYCFGLVAVSQHGVSSEVVKHNFQVEGKLKETRMTMDTVPLMQVGQVAKIGFSIFDPSGAGELRMQSMDDPATLLPGSSLSCTSARSTKYMLDCVGVIDATQVQPGTYRIVMNVENKDSKKAIVTKHTLSVTVKAANP